MSVEMCRSRAKEFFANERTFLHWLNISVTVGSISAAMLGVSGHVHRQWGEEYQHTAIVSRLLALAMMLTSILMAIYAAFLYAWRASALTQMKDSGYHSIILPIVITVVLTFVLVSVLAGAVESYRSSRSDSSRTPVPGSSPGNEQVMSHLVHDASSIQGMS